MEVSPLPDFDESGEVAVRLSGLEDFEGGTAAVYVCANASVGGDPILPTSGDCFAPDTDGYVFGPIVGANFESRYALQLDGIGIHSAQCLLPEDGAHSCQLVVAATLGGDSTITGVALDGLLARVASTRIIEARQLPARPGSRR
jgi:hypothetical protein